MSKNGENRKNQKLGASNPKCLNMIAQIPKVPKHDGHIVYISIPDGD